MSHLSATNDAADTSLTAVMMGEAAATPPETDAAPAAAAPQPLVAFAKKQRRGNMRKRAADDTEPAQLATVSEESDVVRKQKASRGDNPMAFSTKKATDEKLEPFTFDSSRTLQQSTDNRATATLETETAFDRDARALREQVLAQATADPEAQGASGEYKGINNYTDYKKGFRREHTIGAEKGAGQHGPLRANVHARVSVRFDYQPDICKDYKETGFCGYGDACKFVHDRSDYKGGWEIEREWEAEQKAKALRAAEGWNPDEEEGADEAYSDDEDLPFACFVCRKPWEECRDPVVTRCRHYFCENCALKHNGNKKNGGRCAVCDVPTGGIFNVATDIEKKMKEKRKAAVS